MRSLIAQIDTNLLLLELSSSQLANAYIDNKILRPKAFNDAQHVAIATVNELDLVVSWNLRHIANIHRQKKVNAINMLPKNGNLFSFYFMNQ